MRKNHWSKTGKYTPKGKVASPKLIEHCQKIAKERQPHTKLSADNVRSILKLYKNKPQLKDVGRVWPGGKVSSYEGVFAKTYNHDYGVTSNQLYNIITNKPEVWKCIYQEIMSA